VYSREELQRLLDICNERNIFLVVDETYREFVYDGREPLSILHLDPTNERIVVIDSLSKRFSLCGARLGCLITPNQEILAQTLSQAQARLASPSIEQAAAAYMLDVLPDSYVPGIIEEYGRRRDTLFSALSELPDIEVGKPNGAFYSVVRLPVENASDFAQFMLTDFSVDDKTVFVAPANGFYMSYRGGLSKVRIACVLKSESLRDAITILGQGLAQYRRRT
jgi:aspartate aminotransferase